MHQCACQAQSLFHTTGEGFDQCVPLRREINQFEQIIDGVGPFLARYAMYAGIKFEIFNCGEVRIDAEEVRHIANFPLNEGRYLTNFLVVKPNLTRGGGEKCCQNTYERCFTGSIRANQPINGAWCYLQIEIFECIDVAIAFRNMLYFDHIFVLLIMLLLYEKGGHSPATLIPVPRTGFPHSQNRLLLLHYEIVPCTSSEGLPKYIVPTVLS